MGNLYGDLVSDLGAGMVGGISAAVGINVGDGVRVYESFHGAPREAVRRGPGQPAAHPLRRRGAAGGQGEEGAAQRIRAATEQVLTEGRVRTPDLGGQAGTVEMAAAIAAAMR